MFVCRSDFENITQPNNAKINLHGINSDLSTDKTISPRVKFNKSGSRKTDPTINQFGRSASNRSMHETRKSRVKDANDYYKSAVDTRAASKKAVSQLKCYYSNLEVRQSFPSIKRVNTKNSSLRLRNSSVLRSNKYKKLIRNIHREGGRLGQTELMQRSRSNMGTHLADSSNINCSRNKWQNYKIPTY